MTLDPPPIATWLMLRLTSGPRRESLIGDLLERYQERPSTTWYWRQVFVAIVVTNAAEIWNHQALALRAVVLGWSTTYLLGWLIGTFMMRTMSSSIFRFYGTETDSFLPFILNTAILVGHVRTAVVRVGTGWLVARLHSPHEASMVFAFLSSFLILDLPWLLRSGIDAAAFGHTPIVAMFMNHLVSVIITVAGVMAGLTLGSKNTNNNASFPETVGA